MTQKYWFDPIEDFYLLNQEDSFKIDRFLGRIKTTGMIYWTELNPNRFYFNTREERDKAVKIWNSL